MPVLFCPLHSTAPCHPLSPPSLSVPFLPPFPAGVLLFPIFGWLVFIAACVGILCFIIRLPWILAQICITPLICCSSRRREVRTRISERMDCLDVKPVMEKGATLMFLPFALICDKSRN